MSTLMVSFKGSDVRFVAALRAKGTNIIKALAIKMNSLMIRLQAKIVGEKLQGQVLHHRSGKLQDSIRVIPAAAVGTKIVASVEGAGGVAWYGRLHEFGYDVPAHHRRVGYSAKGSITKLLSKTGRLRKNVATIRTGDVRGYVIPERSFMRTSQQEMEATIQLELRETASEVAKQP